MTDRQAGTEPQRAAVLYKCDWERSIEGGRLMERKLEDRAGGDDIPDTELHTPLNVKPERGERE